MESTPQPGLAERFAPRRLVALDRPRTLARLSVLAFAATISTGELCIYETGAGQPFPVLTTAWAF